MQEAELRPAAGATQAPAQPGASGTRAVPALPLPQGPAAAAPSGATMAAQQSAPPDAQKGGGLSVAAMAGTGAGAAAVAAAVAVLAALLIWRARRRAHTSQGKAGLRSGSSKWPAAGLGVGDGHRKVVTDSAYRSDAWGPEYPPDRASREAPEGPGTSSVAGESLKKAGGDEGQGSGKGQGFGGESNAKSWRSSSLSSVPSSAAPSAAVIDEDSIAICRREDGSDFLLGQGSFGEVYKALRNGVQVSKTLHPSS